MKTKLQTSNLDPETRILLKYKEPVLEIIRNLARSREMSQVCREKLNGMKPGRLTELHTETRSLTPYYLGKLLRGGIVTIEQILQGKNLKDLPEEDQILIRKLSMDERFVKLYGRYQDQGKLDKLMQLMEFGVSSDD